MIKLISVIEEANWLTLEEDVDDIPEKPADGFDAVLCLGNSFAHLPDFDGNLMNQKEALSNFKVLVKPGGILVIDHRNYDEILKTGSVPAKNVYYNVSVNKWTLHNYCYLRRRYLGQDIDWDSLRKSHFLL